MPFHSKNLVIDWDAPEAPGITYSFGLGRMGLTKGTRRNMSPDRETVVTHLIRIVDSEDVFTPKAILEFQSVKQRDAVFAALSMSSKE